MTKLMSKSKLIQKIAERHTNNLTQDGALDALADIGHVELERSGVFLVHEFVKFMFAEKPTTEAHEGINPFTGQSMRIEAKPGRKVVRARLAKAIKDAVSQGGDPRVTETARRRQCSPKMFLPALLHKLAVSVAAFERGGRGANVESPFGRVDQAAG